MEARDVIVAIIVFGLFSTLLISIAFSLYAGLGINLDAQTNTSLSRLYSAANKSQYGMFGIAGDMQAKAPAGSKSINPVQEATFLGKVLQTGYAIIMLIPNTISITSNLIEVYADELHIDPIFVTAGMAIIVVTLILLIAGAMLGSRVLR